MTLAQAHEKQFGKVSYPFELYDDNGNETYFEDSDGFWSKGEYDSKGNVTYFEDSTGIWSKSEYDSKGNVTYYENSDGFWAKSEYDSKGKETYFENSNGVIRGSKKSSCNGKVVEIDGKKYKLKEL